MQVFGGHGYIKEHGMEQIVRDARISTLYEGTTGIQALDLLGRKVLLGSKGKCIARLHPADGQFAVPTSSSAPRWAPWSRVLAARAAEWITHPWPSWCAQRGQRGDRRLRKLRPDVLRASVMGYYWAL